MRRKELEYVLHPRLAWRGNVYGSSPTIYHHFNDPYPQCDLHIRQRLLAHVSWGSVTYHQRMIYICYQSRIFYFYPYSCRISVITMTTTTTPALVPPEPRSLGTTGPASASTFLPTALTKLLPQSPRSPISPQDKGSVCYRGPDFRPVRGCC